MPADGGIRFGQYVLLRRIARGGMAEVFLAQQRGLEGFDRRVAVKRILPHLADSPDFVKMFLAEAKLAAQLSHPNVVHIYEFGKVAADFFIAMEFVDGVHAGQLFERAETERLPVTLVARLGADAAAALHHAHELRAGNGKPLALVHRDVSPANLMVSFDGVVKLCDFGIAKAAALTDAKTNPGHVKGKYAYMSPEQTIAQPLDGRSDVFSLAIVLWELLAGRTIVSRTKDPIDVMRAIRDGKLPPIEQVVPDVPPALARALGWAMQTRVGDRATAADLAQALEAFIKASPELATPMQLGAWVRARFPRDAAASATPTTAAAPGTAGGTAGGTDRGGRGDGLDALDAGDSLDTGAGEPRDDGPHDDDLTIAAARRPMTSVRELAQRSLPVTPLAAPPRPAGSPSRDEAATVPTPKVARDRAARPTGDHDRTTAARDRPPRPTPIAVPVTADTRDSSPLGSTAGTRSRPSATPNGGAELSTGASPPMPPRTPMPPTRRDATPPTTSTSGAPSPDSRRRRLQTTLVVGPSRVRLAIAIGGIVVLGIASFLIALATRSHGVRAPADATAAAGAHARDSGVELAATDHGAARSDGGATTAVHGPSITAIGPAPVDGRDLLAAGSAAEWQRGVVDAGTGADVIDTQGALLEVVSTPPGATVRIGDQTRAAPAKFALLAGTYTVLFELAGYERDQHVVELLVGDHLRLDAVLVKSTEHHGEPTPPTATTGHLTVRTTPYSVVYLGGTQLGETPFADVEIAAGTYTLRFENPDHGTSLRKVTIVAGKTTKLSFALP